MNNKPSYFLKFKIIGVVGVIAALAGFILAITGFGDFESNNFMIGGFLSVAGIMMGGVGLMLGFLPEIAQARAKAARYIQEKNKEDLLAIARNQA